MSEESGKAIVYMQGERLTPNPIGRPPKPPEPSFHDRMRKFVASQDIGLSDELFEKVWQRYQEFSHLYGPESMATYWIWKCSGCFCDESWHLVHNGRHQPQCDGINDELKTLWPRSVVEAVANAKNITVRF